MLSGKTRHLIASLLDAATLAAPDDRPAIIYVATDRETQMISRKAFSAAAHRHAAALQRLGVRPRDLVVIAHTQDLESIYLFWGCLLMGAVPTMFPTLTEKLDADVYMGSMAELVRLSGVAAVLTTDEFAATLQGAVAASVYGSAVLAGDSGQNASVRPQIDPTSVAFLQHSSGTTGLQKGVALSHTAVLNQVAAYSDAIALSEDDVIVSWLPLYHDMGLIAGFLLPIIQGVPLVLMSPFDWVQHPALLLRAIDTHKGTLCWQPNFAYNHAARRIRQRDTADLSLASMRLFVNCSEPVRADSHQLFLERFAANGLTADMLGASYAMAENVFAVSQTPPGRAARLDVIDGEKLISEGVAVEVDAAQPTAQVRVSSGVAIDGTAVRVLDKDGNALPDRCVGELTIRSHCLLTGYYRREDLAPLTADGWFRTGDLGYRAGDDLFVIGRSKDVIINAGKNVYPQDIEAIVNTVPGVRAGRAVAFGVPDEREGTELIVVVAEAALAETAVANLDQQRELKQAIRQAVATHTAVSVTFVELVEPKWLLKTSSGKIARAANRDKWLRLRPQSG